MKLYIKLPATFKLANLMDNGTEDGEYLKKSLESDPRWVSVWYIKGDIERIKNILRENKIKYDLKN